MMLACLTWGVPDPRPFSRGGSRGLVLTSSRQRSYAPVARLAWGVPDPGPIPTLITYPSLKAKQMQPRPY
jgi:hypothetical protein